MPNLRIDLWDVQTETALQAIKNAVILGTAQGLQIAPEKITCILQCHQPSHVQCSSNAYLFIELCMFSGRTSEMKKAVYEGILSNLANHTQITAPQTTITIIDIPPENWCLGGTPGDLRK